METGLRKRTLTKEENTAELHNANQNSLVKHENKERLIEGTFWLTRILLLRAVSFVYG